MANSDLRGKYYNIPPEKLNQLANRLNSYKGNKKAIGYTTINNLVRNKKISYENAKKILNTYTNANNAPKDELTLYLLEPVVDFLSNLLNRERTGIRNVKDAKSTVIDNAYIKPHEKQNGTKIAKLEESKKIFLVTEATFKKLKIKYYDTKL